MSHDRFPSGRVTLPISEIIVLGDVKSVNSAPGSWIDDETDIYINRERKKEKDRKIERERADSFKGSLQFHLSSLLRISTP